MEQGSRKLSIEIKKKKDIIYNKMLTLQEETVYDDLERYLHTEVDNGIALGLTKEEVEEINDATSPVSIMITRERFYNRGDDWVLIPPWQRVHIGEEMTLSMWQMKNWVSTSDNPKEVGYDEVSLVDRNKMSLP